MDVTVKPADTTHAWSLTDLLGRSMGRILQHAEREFFIEPAGQAVGTMKGIKKGPHASLDEALAEIERHTRGVCRRLSGEDQEQAFPKRPGSRS